MWVWVHSLPLVKWGNFTNSSEGWALEKKQLSLLVFTAVEDICHKTHKQTNVITLQGIWTQTGALHKVINFNNIPALPSGSTRNVLWLFSMKLLFDFSLVICGMLCVVFGHSKILQAGWLKQKKGIFSQFFAWKSKIKVLEGLVSSKASLPVSSYGLPSLCLWPNVLSLKGQL